MREDFDGELSEEEEEEEELLGGEDSRKHKRRSGDDGDPRRHFFPEGTWIIAYADLMTTLMIFFMILYAYSTLKTSARYEKTMASIQKGMGGDAKQLEKISKQEKEAELANRMESYIKDKNLSQFAQVETNEQRVKISLSNPILFDLGSSDLKPEAMSALIEIAGLLKKIPNPVIVDGHTDNVPIGGGIYRSNFELSAARAFSVIRFFIENERMAPSRFSAYGYGEYKPLFANDTDEHRAMNRRIEINILRQG